MLNAKWRGTPYRCSSLFHLQTNDATPPPPCQKTTKRSRVNCCTFWYKLCSVLRSFVTTTYLVCVVASFELDVQRAQTNTQNKKKTSNHNTQHVRARKNSHQFRPSKNSLLAHSCGNSMLSSSRVHLFSSSVSMAPSACWSPYACIHVCVCAIASTCDILTATCSINIKRPVGRGCDNCFVQLRLPPPSLSRLFWRFHYVITPYTATYCIRYKNGIYYLHDKTAICFGKR